MSASVNQWTLRRRLLWVFIALGMVTVLITTLVTISLVRLDHARRDRVELYGPALLATETLGKAYSDQETGVRGYVSAADPEFLTPYTDGLTAELVQERRLHRLLRLRPDLLSRLGGVVTAARAWQRTVADPAIAVTKQKGPRGTTLTQILEGRERFNAVRSALHRLQRPVRVTVDAASVSLQHQLNVVRAVLVGCLALFVLVGAATARAMRRWVTEPLGRFGSEVDRVEAGDLAHSVRVESGPDEIRALARQVDGMRMRIVSEVALAQQARDDALQARAMVEEQAVELVRSNTELEQFAYVASHDLQEPLRKVASFCQLLERRYKGQLDERGEQYIDYAVDGAKRMQRLINDLLAFSRVGRLTVEFGPVDLEEALAQAERQLAEALEETGATVTHDLLPTVDGDGTLLVQLFQNLVGNGLKFRAELPPRVHISARRAGEFWEFSCSDNGIGIDGQYAEKIFQIFQRLHGRDAYGGTGIGLALCKKIVEHHGGRMWLDTAVTDGASFRWTIPAAEPPEVAEGVEGDERMGDDAVSTSSTD